MVRTISRWELITSAMVRVRPRVKSILADADLVIVHGQYHWLNAAVVEVCRRMAVPFVLMPHSRLSVQAARLRKYGYWMLFERRAFSYCCGLVLSSNLQLEDIRGRVSPPKIAILGLGVRRDVLEAPLKLAKHDVVVDDTLRLLYLGRWDIVGKGLDIFIEACRVLRDSLRLRIRLVGPSTRAQRQEVEARVLSAGLRNSVEMLDATPDVVSQYRWADVTVLPSRADGFGLTVLEALAHGCPVVVTSESGIAEWVRQYPICRVATLAEEAIVSAICELATAKRSQEGCQQAVETALAVRARFAWRSLVDQWDAFLRDVVR
jgi:glycosyltransferase involved in cell wall biosynthesis